MHKKYILFSALYCLVYACTNATSTKENDVMPTVLIFKDAPSQVGISIGSLKLTGIMEADIAFVDTTGMIQYFSPNRTGYDTLILHTANNYIEIAHAHKALDILHFYIKSGDIVLFTYDENFYPTLKSYTSEQLTQQYNFAKDIPNRQFYYRLEPLSLLNSSIFWNIYKNVNKNKGKKILNEISALYIPMDTVMLQANTYIQNYHKLLKGQFEEGLLTHDFYEYYLYQWRNKQIAYATSDFYYTKNAAQNDLTEFDQIYKDYFKDERCSCISYLYSMDRYLWLYSATAFPLIAENYGSSDRSYYDYRMVFDSLSIKQNIPPKTRSYMLYQLLDKIIMYFSVEDIERYKNLYVQITGDTLKAKNKLLERGITATNNEDMQLKDKNGQEINYATVREQYKGKVVYVDFWASWCAPCRAAMPEALKLRKEYEDKEVVFLYLALNDREDTWKDAVKKSQLEMNGINYFIVNSKSSKTIQELKVESIPRYMLYDKSGKLVYHRAPGPYSKAIREQLDKLLK